MTRREVPVYIVDLEEVLDGTSQQATPHKTPLIGLVQKADEGSCDLAGLVILEERSVLSGSLDDTEMGTHPVPVCKQLGRRAALTQLQEPEPLLVAKSGLGDSSDHIVI